MKERLLISMNVRRVDHEAWNYPETHKVKSNANPKLSSRESVCKILAYRNNYTHSVDSFSITAHSEAHYCTYTTEIHQQLRF